MAGQQIISMEPSICCYESVSAFFGTTKLQGSGGEILNPRKCRLDCPENICFNKGRSPLAGETN
jgi:hypothetical protein